MSSLNILFIEDSEDDYFFLKKHIDNCGLSFNSQWVFLKSELISCMESRRPFDVVLCDHVLPDMDSHTALEIVRDYTKYTSFLVVSQAIGEHAAVQIMKAGANDCIMKNDLGRLTSYLQQAVVKKTQHKSIQNTKLNDQKVNFAVADSILKPIKTLQNIAESLENLISTQQIDNLVFQLPEIAGELKSYSESLADLVRINTTVIAHQRVKPKDVLSNAIEFVGGDINVVNRFSEDIQFYADHFLLHTAFTYILKLFKSHLDYHNDNQIVTGFQDNTDKYHITFKYSGNGLGEFTLDDLEKALTNANQYTYKSLLNFYIAKCAVEKLSGKMKLYTSHEMGTLVSVLFFKRKFLMGS